MATSGDLDLATSGDFFMATDMAGAAGWPGVKVIGGARPLSVSFLDLADARSYRDIQSPQERAVTAPARGPVFAAILRPPLRASRTFGRTRSWAPPFPRA
jgi:hypothetical protein